MLAARQPPQPHISGLQLSAILFWYGRCFHWLHLSFSTHFALIKNLVQCFVSWPNFSIVGLFLLPSCGHCRCRRYCRCRVVAIVIFVVDVVTIIIVVVVVVVVVLVVIVTTIVMVIVGDILPWMIYFMFLEFFSCINLNLLSFLPHPESWTKNLTRVNSSTLFLRTCRQQDTLFRAAYQNTFAASLSLPLSLFLSLSHTHTHSHAHSNEHACLLFPTTIHTHIPQWNTLTLSFNRHAQTHTRTHAHTHIHTVKIKANQIEVRR